MIPIFFAIMIPVNMLILTFVRDSWRQGLRGECQGERTTILLDTLPRPLSVSEIRSCSFKPAYVSLFAVVAQKILYHFTHNCLVLHVICGKQ